MRFSFARGSNLFKMVRWTGRGLHPLGGPRSLATPTLFTAAFTIQTYLRRDEASYRPSGDTVHMRQSTRLQSAADYRSVRSTRPFILPRPPLRAAPPDLSGRFGSEAYALEEIIASSAVRPNRGPTTPPMSRPDCDCP
jgi:hypothetical protein